MRDTKKERRTSANKFELKIGWYTSVANSKFQIAKVILETLTYRDCDASLRIMRGGEVGTIQSYPPENA